MKTLIDYGKLKSDLLVQLVMLNGNNLAFEALMKNNAGIVKRKIRSMLRGNAFEEDLYQDTYVIAYFRLKDGKFDTKFSFESWITSVAKNMCCDFLRSNKSRNTCSYDRMTAAELNRYEIAEEAESVSEMKQRTIFDKALVTKMLNLMSAGMQRATRLKASGLSRGAIGREMRLPEDRVCYILKKVKKISKSGREIRNKMLAAQPLSYSDCRALKLDDHLAEA